jgi:hypothetical protein
MPADTIYVSYTSEDALTANRLKRELSAAGYTIATDYHTVPAGSRLKPALQTAMADAARFLFCFSSHRGLPTSWQEVELALALKRLESLPPATPWLTPVKLTACEIPALRVGDGTLSELAIVDLGIDWETGIARLLASLPVPPPTVVQAESTPTGTSNMKLKVGTLRGNATIANVKGQSGGGKADASIEIDDATLDNFDFTNVDNRR